MSVHKVAVIGDKSSVLAFKVIGVEVVSPVGVEETRRAVNRLARENAGVIFITEALAQTIPETIDRYANEPAPAIILIPSNQGSLGIGKEWINKNVEKAIGSNII